MTVEGASSLRPHRKQGSRDIQDEAVCWVRSGRRPSEDGNSLGWLCWGFQSSKGLCIQGWKSLHPGQSTHPTAPTESDRLAGVSLKCGQRWGDHCLHSILSPEFYTHIMPRKRFLEQEGRKGRPRIRATKALSRPRNATCDILHGKVSHVRKRASGKERTRSWHERLQGYAKKVAFGIFKVVAEK